MMPHRSRRWVGEMEEIALTFKTLGLTPKILEGAADMYRFVGGTNLADQTPREPDPPIDVICRRWRIICTTERTSPRRRLTMSILVTMQVGPVDWTKFKAALDRFGAERPVGLHSSRTYRQQGDASRVSSSKSGTRTTPCTPSRRRLVTSSTASGRRGHRWRSPGSGETLVLGDSIFDAATKSGPTSLRAHARLRGQERLESHRRWGAQGHLRRAGRACRRQGHRPGAGARKLRCSAAITSKRTSVTSRRRLTPRCGRKRARRYCTTSAATRLLTSRSSSAPTTVRPRW